MNRNEPRPAEPNIREGQISFRGFSTWYQVTGNSNSKSVPVILLHGGPGYPSYSLEPMEKLANVDRVVVRYDQIGCGKSSLKDVVESEFRSIIAGFALMTFSQRLSQSLLDFNFLIRSNDYLFSGLYYTSFLKLSDYILNIVEYYMYRKKNIFFFNYSINLIILKYPNIIDLLLLF